jgi:hypothetical protein
MGLPIKKSNLFLLAAQLWGRCKFAERLSARNRNISTKTAESLKPGKFNWATFPVY